MNKTEAIKIAKTLNQEELKIFIGARAKPGDLLVQSLADSPEQYKAFSSLVEKKLLKPKGMMGMLEVTKEFEKVQIVALNLLLKAL